ncbi:MAG: MarR family transcriptional regulator [Pseudomonadota bacterium]
MAESLSLRLLQAGRAHQRAVAERLLAAVDPAIYQGLTAASLGFLADLDCGANHAAELARQLGVSRQAVNRTVQELEAQGLLETRADPLRRNQRLIAFTAKGEALMADCRQALAEMDAALLSVAEVEAVEAAIAILERSARS